ncbi:MAG: tRNA epoxyqueuosine(34) reductase QueG [Chitinophagaceae bacterium]|nr:MAG: tRNA epoxyqueuosine(34) reductase QueG [Chitinophagaceae bacterium]
MNPSQRSAIIKSVTAKLGFDYCGIAKAVRLDEDARRLEQWLNKGMNGTMQYMENYFDLRTDPTKLVPGAESVITLMMNYYPGEIQKPDTPKISKYAYGQDYHHVIRKKLKQLLQFIRDHIGEVQGRGFVDSAPVLERSWAQRSGLGWIGKNGNLITRQHGSFYFIATLITDLILDYDDPFAKDYCGSCRRCIDACPTDAIQENKVIDGSKCISYFTIELKEQLIPDEMQGKFKDWVFGCDICQDVCPWNRFAVPQQEQAFTPVPEVLNFTTGDWEALTEEKFNEIFQHSPIKRSKYAGIRRNLRFIQQKNKTP